MRILFAGTPAFAEIALKALINCKAEVVAVLTQPDRPSGRGQQLKQSPVKLLANQSGLPVLQPTTLKNEEIQKRLVEYKPDLMIVAAYGLILPAAVLQIPSLGCLNIHASLLPRWRGAAPIQRAIQAGDKETGITIMQMDAGLDTGDMLLKKVCGISHNDTAETLHDKLATLGAEAIIDALKLLREEELRPIAQNNENATYAAKITKEEAQINWCLAAEEIERSVRSYNPYPGASSNLNNQPIRVWQAKVGAEKSGAPGEIVDVLKNEIVVACGSGTLNIEILQRPNAKALKTNQFLQGFPIKAGDRFSSH